METLYLIPARGGSKGIPGKNIKSLAGKPLIHYTIDAAREVASDFNICVSTDSEDIKEVVERHGLAVPFLRPSYLSTDGATTEAVILHALEFFHEKGRFYDKIVLLQPTSPLRTGNHIKEAENIFSKDLDMVVSAFETKANPYYLLFEEEGNGFLFKTKEASFTRRQDCPKVYELNGAIYIINSQSIKDKGMKAFKRIKKYEMDRRSSLDIDDEFDWLLTELLMLNGNRI